MTSWRRGLSIAPGLLVLALSAGVICPSHAQMPLPTPGAGATAPTLLPGQAQQPLAPAASVSTSATARLPAKEEDGAVEAAAKWRDPFWPVGYAPPEPTGKNKPGDAESAARAGEAEWRAAQKLLITKGVSRVRGRGDTPAYAALINGRLVESGETVSVSMYGKTFRWRVARITMAEGPTFERMVAPPAAAKGTK